MSFNIRFWGVRGSVPSPGPETAGVGGNTSCVEVTCGDQRIILDGGTGLRRLGNALTRESPGKHIDATILLSHVHWDHIQGIPFFTPIYIPGNTLRFVTGSNPTPEGSPRDQRFRLPLPPGAPGEGWGEEKLPAPPAPLPGERGAVIETRGCLRPDPPA